MLQVPDRQYGAENDSLFELIWNRIEAAGSAQSMVKEARFELCQLLRRESDSVCREKAVTLIEAYFSALDSTGTPSAALIESLKSFIGVVVQIVISARPRRNDDKTVGDVALRYSLEYVNVPFVERPTRPTDIDVIPAPEAIRCSDFQTLLGEAIVLRLRTATNFFQRRNPTLQRRQKRLFLMSPVFADRLEKVVRAYILPKIVNRKLTSFLAISQDWTDVTTDGLWYLLDREKCTKHVMEAWNATWREFHRVKVMKAPAPGQEAKEVWMRRPELGEIRTILSCSDYDLPPVDNEFLEFLASLLTDYGKGVTDQAWVRLRQYYEQEMDQRIYQDTAREGALRDKMLECFDTYPDRIAEMIVLLCYFCFPKLSIRFLYLFTRSRGLSEEERQKRIPQLMRFLEQPGTLEIMAEEDKIEEQRQRAMEQYRAQLRATAAKAPQGAVVWNLGNGK